MSRVHSWVEGVIQLFVTLISKLPLVQGKFECYEDLLRISLDFTSLGLTSKYGCSRFGLKKFEC